MDLSQLEPGKTGTIKDFTDLELSVKLMEMGCLPGEEVKVNRRAPLGGPIAITIGGQQIGLRICEASTITIEEPLSA